MRRIPLVLALVLPLAAVANEEGNKQKIKVDAEKLQRATPASAMLNEKVRSNEGREVGDVEDIVISQDGEVRHFLVNANDKLRGSRFEQSGNEDRQDMDVVADQREPANNNTAASDDGSTEMMTVAGEADEDSAAMTTASGNNDASRGEERESGARDDARPTLAGASDERQENRGAQGSDEQTMGWSDNDNVAAISPQSVSYSNDAEHVSVDAGSAESRLASSVSNGGSDMRVGDLIGMEVHLSDKESFGEVEDVMLSEDNSEVVALVVDHWEGLDKQRHALRMQDAQIDFQEEQVRYEYNAADVEELPEFNLDRYTDDGWDVTEW